LCGKGDAAGNAERYFLLHSPVPAFDASMIPPIVAGVAGRYVRSEKWSRKRRK
jgi:hypothetical protein